MTVHVAVTIALDLRQEESNSQETIMAVTAQHAQKKNLLGIHSITTDPREESGVRLPCCRMKGVLQGRAEIEVPIAIGIHVSDQNVQRKEEIKAVHQVERIVTHALKKNHHLEIVHLMEKVEVAVAHRVNVVRVQVMI